jgi:hypothetical protein
MTIHVQDHDAALMAADGSARSRCVAAGYSNCSVSVKAVSSAAQCCELTSAFGGGRTPDEVYARQQIEVKLARNQTRISSWLGRQTSRRIFGG